VDILQEIFRKLIHLTSVAFPLIYYLYGKEIVLWFTYTWLVIFLVLEYIRLEFRFKFPIVAPLFRVREEGRLAGVVFFLLSTIVVIAIFPKEIACASLLMATFGDAMGAIVGKIYGLKQIPYTENKTVGGTFTEFLVDFIIGIIVFHKFHWINRVLLTSVMSITATFIELIARKIDDNLLISIFGSTMGYIVWWLI
jgi:dolichol kinase